jgi:molybdate/tungstate transport system substrate-binding protein
VIGYNRKSKFAHDLETMPWYKVAAMPGFKLGRTDPKIDPKGVLADDALTQAAKTYNEPALAAMEKSSSEVYPEQTLVGRLQAGQLDAGFFYGVEASAAKIPTVSLGTIKLSASYTISILNNAPHVAGAEAFVSWLFGSQAAPLLMKEGITPLRPTPIFVHDLKPVLTELVSMGTPTH